jgi:heme/copper-type cytochrome/quinol oxidase subunit 2
MEGIENIINLKQELKLPVAVYESHRFTNTQVYLMWIMVAIIIVLLFIKSVYFIWKLFE